MGNALRGVPASVQPVGTMRQAIGRAHGTTRKAFPTATRLPLLRPARCFHNLNGRSGRLRSRPGLIDAAACPQSPSREDDGGSQQTAAKYQRRHRLCSDTIRREFGPHSDHTAAGCNGFPRQGAEISPDRPACGVPARFARESPASLTRVATCRQTIPRLRAVRCRAVLVIRGFPMGRKKKRR